MSFTLIVPGNAMVLLVGISGSGKTAFAARHFAPTDVLSSDDLRALVAGDPVDQSATEDAFRVLNLVLEMRLARGLLTVVDATNVQDWARGILLRIARRAGRAAVAVVLDLPLEVCLERNALRDRRLPPAAVRRQHRWLRDSLASLSAEGFATVCVLSSPEEVEGVRLERT